MNKFKININIFLSSIFHCLFLSSVMAADVESCINEPSQCTGVLRQTAGEPKIGDIYKNSIDINKNIKILLPQGVWEVNNIGE